MRGPKPVPIELSEEERQALEALVRRKSTGQQVALRARLILAAAEGLNNAQIGRQLGVEADTVRLWRGRWRAWQAVDLAELSAAERLADAPRPGAPARITAEQVGRLVALACEAPSASGAASSSTLCGSWDAAPTRSFMPRRASSTTSSPHTA